jgi:hypothetical protein
VTIDKKQVDAWIPKAYQAIQGEHLLEADGKLKKAYRGQIAAFGAAVSMGSVSSAVAFFSEKGGSDVDRQRLMDAIACVLGKDKLSEYAQQPQAKREIVHAAIALKLAMNLYDWSD